MKKTAIALIATGTVGIALVSCAKEPPNPIDKIPAQTGWVQPAKNPVMPAGSMYPQALWGDPTVIKDGGQYVMYMSSSIKEPFKPPVVPFRAVSGDGIHWKLEPQGPVLTPEGTPFVSMETPTVVKYKNTYHMFYTAIYTGKLTPGDYVIGHAVSPDGIHWTSSKKAVLSPASDIYAWNGYFVSEPGAIVYKDQIYLYFAATGGSKTTGGPVQIIGLVKTTDGEHFTAPQKVVERSSLYPEEQGFAGYSTPQPFLMNGKIHLVYNVTYFSKKIDPNWQQVALHHAVSADGETGFVQDDKPMFRRTDLPWANGELISPTALAEGDEVKLWFGGHIHWSQLGPLFKNNFSGPEFGINYATHPAADFGK